MLTFNGEDVSEYMAAQNDGYKHGMVSMVIKRYGEYIDDVLGEPVVANKNISTIDIERYLLSFLFSANLVGKTKEELAEMVADHFRMAWKREVDGLEFSLSSMPKPKDRESMIDRLVIVKNIDELKRKISG